MQTYDVLYKREESDSVGLYAKCGILLKRDDGTMAFKLDVVPISSEWDGWLAISEQQPDDYQDGVVELSAMEEPSF